MKRLLATITLMALALPATATDTDCVDHAIAHAADQTNGTPVIVDRSGVVDGLRTGIIGHYFVTTIDGVSDSVDVDPLNISGVTACLDGTVTLHYSETVADYVAPVIEDVTAEEWAEHHNLPWYPV